MRKRVTAGVKKSRWPRIGESDWDATVINQTGMQLFCVRLGCNCFVSDWDATVLCQTVMQLFCVRLDKIYHQSPAEKWF